LFDSQRGWVLTVARLLCDGVCHERFILATLLRAANLGLRAAALSNIRRSAAAYLRWTKRSRSPSGAPTTLRALDCIRRFDTETFGLANRASTRLL
jgi:hypothetical protein